MPRSVTGVGGGASVGGVAPPAMVASVTADLTGNIEFVGGTGIMIVADDTTDTVTITNTSPGGGADHGSLVGLGDDDHTQYHNDARGDVRYYTQTQLDADQLTQYLLVDGTRAMTGELAMGNNKITGLGTPTATTDAATKDYVDTEVGGAGDFFADGSVPMTGNLDMDSNAIVDCSLVQTGQINLSGTNNLVSSAGTANVQFLFNAAEKARFDTNGLSMSAEVDMGANRVVDVGTPTAATDAATKDYVDTEITGAVVTDHGALTGLGDDDHTQYTLADGTRAFTGSVDVGGNFINNVDTIQASAASDLEFAVGTNQAFNFPMGGVSTFNVGGTTFVVVNGALVSTSVPMSVGGALDMNNNAITDVDTVQGLTGNTVYLEGIGAGSSITLQTNLSPGIFISETDILMFRNTNLNGFNLTDVVNVTGRTGFDTKLEAVSGQDLELNAVNGQVSLDVAGAAKFIVAATGCSALDDLNMNSNNITNVADPTAESDAVPRSYVDKIVNHFHFQQINIASSSDNDMDAGETSGWPVWHIMDTTGELRGATVVVDNEFYDSWATSPTQTCRFRWYVNATLTDDVTLTFSDMALLGGGTTPTGASTNNGYHIFTSAEVNGTFSSGDSLALRITVGAGNITGGECVVNVKWRPT